MQQHPHFSTKKANVIKVGTTYNKDFGTAELSDFKELAFIEYANGAFEIPVSYYYRITTDHYIQLIDVLQLFSTSPSSSEKNRIVGQYKYDTERSFIDNLIALFTDFLHHRRLFDGQIIDFESKILSDENIRQIKKNISDRTQNVNIKSEMLDYLKEKGLSPTAHDATKGMYISSCVNTRHHHLYLIITPEKEEFGCGYCCKKGGLEELKEWVEEKNKQN